MQKTARLVGVTVPAVALMGGIAASQFHPYAARAVTGSLALPARASTVARDASARSGQLGASAEAAAAGALKAEFARARSEPAKAARDVGPAPAASHTPAAAPRRAQSDPHPTTTAAAAPAASARSCTGTGSADVSFLPANYVTIVDFLIKHGYTDMGAAGIAGNIYQESKGDPESIGTGGGGLIGWTPLPAGFVTGNPAADLQTQLSALLTYNRQWAQYIPMLNAATTPGQAADVFMDYFERPGIPASYNRESAAEAVAQACGFV